MRTHTDIKYFPNGDKVETIKPWTAEDYISAIMNIEEEITMRRIREAVLSQEGADWLANKEAEIQALRDELAQIQE